MLQDRRFAFALVAHSQEVADCVRRVADSLDYEIHYHVATSESAIPLAQECLAKGYEVVLCHGGTGRSIVRALGHNAVPIDRTDMDVIKTLREAARVSRTIALAAYLGESHDIAVIEELLGISIHHIVYANWAELFHKVRAAYDQGVRVLVGGGVSKKCMENCGGTGFVIHPNPHSIRLALEQAQATARQKRIEAARHGDLLGILRHLQEGVVCIDDKENLIYSNKRAARLLRLGPGAGAPQLRSFYDALQLRRALSEKTASHDKIVELADQHLVVTAIPLIVHSGVPGALALFRDVPSLQSINRKISEELAAKGLTTRTGLDDIRGRGPAIRDLKRKIRRFAPTGATVRICGETGSGKELVAHALHAESDRRNKAFVAVNCAALPENLIESELFGYEDGAFTGAKRGGKAGLFEMSDGGTIFLDEVGEIRHEVQLRLLRVLETREVMRVGASRIRTVDVRVVCASHRSLIELVEAGRFRLDLYYRLSTLKIAVPPLRDRLEDIPDLLDMLLRRHGKPSTVITPAMTAALRGHTWPGNVRELAAMMESYLIQLEGLAPDEALFEEVFREGVSEMPWDRTGDTGGRPGKSLKDNLRQARVALIRQAVAQHGGDKEAAARELDISPTTLWRALSEAGGS
ncbi:sigma 54-interacting transcriptional regulator [Solidesulfovibrio sp.]|uniref:sigma 54-interacting transcriptional regulator n=1 Tax=Solidesulfovibrio sp. TaxID=2910990 RepID=UPI00260CAAE4|nr:sigma 54-interacting transcriptional regulator [Solidesulfovibrio sp.]